MTVTASDAVLFENLGEPANEVVFEDGVPIVVAVNESFEETFGLEESSIVGTTVDEHIVEPDDQVEATAINRRANAGEAVEREIRRLTADGPRWFLFRSVPFTRDGQQRGIGIYVDITERKHLEERFRSFIEHSTDVISVIDADGTYQYHSPSVERQLGYDPDELVGMDAFELAHPEDRDDLQAAFESVLHDPGSVVSAEFRIRDADGQWRWLESIGKNRIDDPAIDGIVVNSRDVTERKERERQLTTLMDNVPGMVYRCRNERRWPMEFVSEGCRELTGYERATLVEGDVEFGTDVIAARREELWEAVQAAIAEDDVFRVTYPIETAGGERRWVREQGRGVCDESGAIEALEGVMIDVTDEIENTVELERTKSHLERAQRVADMGAVEIDLTGSEPALWMSKHVARILDIDGDDRSNDIDADEDSIERFLAAIHPDDRELVEDAFDRAMAEGVGCNQELRLNTDGQEQRWIRTVGEPVVDDGSVVAIRGFLQDVTEQKERERALEERDRQLTSLMSNIPGMVYRSRYDDDGWTARFVSDGVSDLVGYDPDDLLGGDVDWDEDVVEGNAEELWEPARAALERGEPVKLTVPIETASGERRWVREYASGVYDDDEIVALDGVILDVTDEIESKRELERSNGLLEQAQRIAKLGAWEIDLSSDPPDVWMSEEVARIHGLDPKPELNLDEALEFYESEDRRRFEEVFEECLRSGEGFDLELELVSADGQRRWIRTIGEPVSVDGEVTVFRGASQNVTERKKQERELDQRRRELQTLNGLYDLKGKIVHGVIEQTNRREIEETVCRHLANANQYEFAWIATDGRETDSIEPRCECGVDEYIEAVFGTDDGDDAVTSPPSIDAFRRQETTYCRNIFAHDDEPEWQSLASRYGFESFVAIPIRYEGSAYGVLGVFSDRAGAFAESERAVLEGICDVTGHAIAAVERKRALVSDEVVEITLVVQRITENLDLPEPAAGPVEFDRTVSVGDNRYLVFGNAPFDALDALQQWIESEVLTHWHSLTVLRQDGETVKFQLHLVDPPMFDIFLDYDVELHSASIVNGDFTVNVHVPTHADMHELMDELQSLYPETILSRRRQTAREGRSTHEITERLDEHLTDRQQAALEASYYEGFFEWPRDRSGEEVAESLGIGPSTFHQHLRKAEKQLLDLVYGE